MTSANENKNEALSPAAQVTISGRNVEVPEHFQERVNGKLAKIEKLDPTLTFFQIWAALRHSSYGYSLVAISSTHMPNA